MKKLILRIATLLLIPLSFFVVPEANGNNEVVYVAKIDGEVTMGMAAYVNRAMDIAEKEGASAIIFEMDTYGGAVDAADVIGQHLNSSDTKKIAFINPNAISAGAYIALNMDEIYWTSEGRMGAAAVITSDGNAADEKAQSMWRTMMHTASENAGRDPQYALGMIDESVDLPDYDAPQGKLLTLGAKQAAEVGYSEGTIANLDQLLIELGYANADIRSLDVSWSEKIAGFITNSYIVPILLSIGSLGLVVELYSPGFGVPGFMGITALLLFFYGHFIAGLAGYESIILFILGFVLIVLEFFLPGGIAGFAGLGSIILAILLAGYNIIQMGFSLLIALLIAILAMVILMKFFGRKIRVFNKIILKDSTNSEQGYISNKSRIDLLEKSGIALTPLRPSGTIMIDNERIDAVTEGGFINSGAKVIVVKVEGVRVVVREVRE